MGCHGDSNYPCTNVCLPTPSPLPTGSMTPATGSGQPLCLQWRPHQTQILQIRSELWPARLNRLSPWLIATAGRRSGGHKHTGTHNHPHEQTHTDLQVHYSFNSWMFSLAVNLTSIFFVKQLNAHNFQKKVMKMSENFYKTKNYLPSLKVTFALLALEDEGNQQLWQQ